MPKTMPLHDTRNDLPEKTRQEMVELLNRQLADMADLYSQDKQAHWNVKGPHFFQLHELFDKLAEMVEEDIDLIAERATALGGTARGTVRMAAGATRLKEFQAEATAGVEHLKQLVLRYSDLAATTRAAIEEAMESDDNGTADLFTEVSRNLDKSLWLLEAHLQGNGEA